MKYIVERVYDPENDEILAYWEEEVEEYPYSIMAYYTLCKTKIGEYYIFAEGDAVKIGWELPITPISFATAMSYLDIKDSARCCIECSKAIGNFISIEDLLTTMEMDYETHR